MIEVYFIICIHFFLARWSSRCGIGWYLDAMMGNCYQINTDRKTWPDARAACLAQGGDLASISGLNEQGFVTGKLCSASKQLIYNLEKLCSPVIN